MAILGYCERRNVTVSGSTCVCTTGSLSKLLMLSREARWKKMVASPKISSRKNGAVRMVTKYFGDHDTFLAMG